MFLVLGGPEAARGRILLTNIGAALGLAVIFRSIEMIDFGLEVCPHDRVARAVRLGQVLSRELTGARGRPGRRRGGRSRLSRGWGWSWGRRSGSGRAASTAFGDEVLLGFAAGLD